MLSSKIIPLFGALITAFIIPASPQVDWAIVPPPRYLITLCVNLGVRLDYSDDLQRRLLHANRLQHLIYKAVNQ